jgi:glycerophosphoryl diester phosphodiesterase
MARKTPLLVAHRGASGLAPENTIAAFQLALAMDVDGIELDVHRTVDGVIVAAHDSTVDRTTGANGRIGAMEWARLRELDAGSWFNRLHPELAKPEFSAQRIPSLEDVIALAGGKAHLYIEIKDPDLYPESFESELLSLVRRHRMEDHVTFLSFSRHSLKKMKALETSIRTGLLISRRAGDPCRAALSLKANGLAVLHKLLAPDFVAKIQGAGLELAAWTVDSAEDLGKMRTAQVDAIITNHPEIALEVFS